jgi:hypothetical protein
MCICNRGSVVQDYRTRSVEVRVGAIALELIGIASGASGWRGWVVGSTVANEAEGLAVFWRIQRDLGSVRGMTTSCKVHGLESPVRGLLLSWVAVPAVSLLLALKILLGKLAEEAQLLPSV